MQIAIVQGAIGLPVLRQVLAQLLLHTRELLRLFALRHGGLDVACVARDALTQIAQAFVVGVDAGRVVRGGELCTLRVAQLHQVDCQRLQRAHRDVVQQHRCRRRRRCQ